jgi:hypothetical protein
MSTGEGRPRCVLSGMAAVALGWYAMQFVGTTICYVNRGLHATVAAKFSRR